MSWIAWGFALVWILTPSQTPLMEAVHLVNSCIWSAAGFVLMAMERWRRQKS